MSIKFKSTFWLFFFLDIFAFQNNSFAQLSPYQNLNVEDGLISANVFDIVQDPKGYIWFATDNGLSSFDGVNFNNLTNEDLGVTSYISSIEIINSNKIVFGCGVNGIYQFDVATSKTQRINRTTVSQSNKIVVTEEYIISIHDYHTIEVISIESGDILYTDSIISRDNPNYPLSITQLLDGTILIGRSDGLYKFNTRNFHQEKLYQDKINIPIYSILMGKNGKLYLGTDNEIKVVFNGDIFETIKLSFAEDKRIRNIFIDQYDRIWISPWGGTSVYLYYKGEIKEVNYQTNISIPGVSKFFTDFEGNLWIGTTGKGLYLFKNHFIFNYPTQGRFPNSAIRKIQKSEKGLILGSSDGLGFLNFKSDSIYHIKDLFEYGKYVRDICQLSRNNYVVAITDIRFKKSLKQAFFLNENTIRYIHASCLNFHNGELFAGNWDGKIEIINPIKGSVKSTIESIVPPSVKSKRIDAILVDSDNRIWAGGQFGLCILGDNLKGKFLIGPGSGVSVLKIKQRENNEIEVLTNFGLYIYSVETNNKIITLKDSISLFNVTSYLSLSVHSFIFGTNNGIYFYDKEFIGKLSVFDGLLSESINDLFFDFNAKKVFAATAEGLVAVNYDEALNYFKLRYAIDDAYIDLEQSRISSEKGVFNYDYSKLPINIVVKSIKYSNPKLINYRARINSGKWGLVKNGVFGIHSLQPGKHRIEISAGVNGDWGPTSKYTLNIIPPFYMTTTFYFLSVIIICSIGISSVYFIRRIRKLNREEKQNLLIKLSEFKQKAIASNLNPHFIFNSLNSVQNYISKSEVNKANEYLNLFAQLIRSHINYSDSGFITISNEIDRLKMYLEFEKERLNNSFSYSIEINNVLNTTKTLIPSMILQPFIENAIWHGFAELKEGGKIGISISGGPGGDGDNAKKAHPLVIIIEDNGIGMQSGRPSKHGFQSMGVQLVRERLLNLDGSYPEPVVYTDLHPGTRVTITVSEKAFRVAE